jgi:hypothetical protein
MVPLKAQQSRDYADRGMITSQTSAMHTPSNKRYRATFDALPPPLGARAIQLHHASNLFSILLPTSVY